MQVRLVSLVSLTSYDCVCHSALLNFHALKTKRRCNMCPISSGVLHISLCKCFFPYALSQVHLLRDQALRLSQYSALPGLSSVSGVSSDNSGHSHGSSGSVAFSWSSGSRKLEDCEVACWAHEPASLSNRCPLDRCSLEGLLDCMGFRDLGWRLKQSLPRQWKWCRPWRSSPSLRCEPLRQASGVSGCGSVFKSFTHFPEELLRQWLWLVGLNKTIVTIKWVGYKKVSDWPRKRNDRVVFLFCVRSFVQSWTCRTSFVCEFFLSKLNHPSTCILFTPSKGFASNCGGFWYEFACLVAGRVVYAMILVWSCVYTWSDSVRKIIVPNWIPQKILIRQRWPTIQMTVGLRNFLEKMMIRNC